MLALTINTTAEALRELARSTDFDSSEEFYERCRELHANEADQNLCSKIGRYSVWIWRQSAISTGILLTALNKPAREGNEAAFVAFVDLFNSTDFDLFRDAYMGEA